MVCVWVAFHENDGNHENDEDSYKQGFECWIHGNHGNHGNDENHGNPGCIPQVPQTMGLEIPDFLVKNRRQKCTPTRAKKVKFQFSSNFLRSPKR